MTTTVASEIKEELDPGMEGIVEFITETGITMHVLLAHENPYRSKYNQQGIINWSCKLINTDNNYVVVYFSKGNAIRRWCEPPQTGLGDTIPLHVPHDEIGEPYDGPMPPWTEETTEQDKRTFNYCSQVEPPFLIEVLDILAKDIALIETTGNFEAWCDELKISADSRTARSAFDIVCQQRIEMQALLGEEYNRLLYEVERVAKDPVDDAEIVAKTPVENT